MLFSEERLPASEGTIVEPARRSLTGTLPTSSTSWLCQSEDSSYHLPPAFSPPPRWWRTATSAGVHCVHTCHLSPPHLLTRPHFTTSLEQSIPLSWHSSSSMDPTPCPPRHSPHSLHPSMHLNYSLSAQLPQVLLPPHPLRNPQS